jgi:hypothetical protein
MTRGFRIAHLVVVSVVLAGIVLVNLRDSAPVLAALHPLNAFALLLVAVMLVREDRALLRRGDAEHVPAPASEM